MFNWIKKLFLPQFEGVHDLKSPPDLSSAHKFLKPDDKVEAQLHELLKSLETDNRNNISSGKRKLRSFTNIRDIEKLMMRTLREQHEHITDLFEGEPMRITFYLGKNLIFDGTVEIVLEVYDEKHAGATYMNMVAKLSNGKYSCWSF